MWQETYLNVWFRKQSLNIKLDSFDFWTNSACSTQQSSVAQNIGFEVCRLWDPILAFPLCDPRQTTQSLKLIPYLEKGDNNTYFSGLIQEWSEKIYLWNFAKC